MIALVATYLLWVLAACFGLVWLLAEGRSGKVTLAAATVIGLVLVLVLIVIAGALHNDPRPFVDNPALRPLISHAPDNGFPSDHSAAAALIATLVILRHRWYGAVFGIGALAVAWARVAAHVHHVQDVVAGLVIGGVAGWAGLFLAGVLINKVTARTDTRIGGAVHALMGPTGDPSRHRGR
jgi:membrane-associated phospholipid phosphatase